MSGKTKYIMSMGEIKRKDNSIAFINDLGNNYIPIKEIREIYFLNEVSLNSKFLDFAGKSGVVMHFFNYFGHYSGSFYPRKQLISGRLLVKQCEAYINKREVIAKAIVLGISENMHETLYHYYKHNCKEIKLLLDWYKIEVPILLSKVDDIKRILYIEGMIWEKFYNTFDIILNKDFIFEKRSKRPPENPLNALISFGNSMLYTKTITQIYNTHLEQSISYLHEPMESRFSLSLDLSEVFKPILVFKTIFDVINNRKIQVLKHFDKNLNYCLLNENGRKIFVSEFEERLNTTFQHKKLNRRTTYFNAIKLDGYKLIKFLMEGREFKPFSLKEMM